MTAPTTSAPDTSRGARVRGLIARAASLEGLMYASIGRALRRRPAIPAGATGFGYHSSSMTLLIIFIALSVVELVIIDLIVHRWVPVRIFFLVIGIWGVVWMTGLLCSHLMRPHTVGPDGIRVRDGLDLDLPVTWDDIHSVEIRNMTDEPKSPRIVAPVDGSTPDGATLAVRVTDTTNIRIVLEGPTAVALPGQAPKGGVHEVTVIRLWADDPRAFLAEVGRHI